MSDRSSIYVPASLDNTLVGAIAVAAMISARGRGARGLVIMSTETLEPLTQREASP